MKTATEQLPYVTSQERAFKLMQSWEREMNDYAANVVKRIQYSASVPGTFTMTASEIQVFNYLKEQFRKAEAAWHEAAKRDDAREAEEHKPCLFIGGTNDGRRLHVASANRVWLLRVPKPSAFLEAASEEVYRRMTFCDGSVCYAHDSLTFEAAIELLFKHYNP